MSTENTVKDPITGRVKGVLYNGPLDCLWKTFKAEGIAGWYKGASSQNQQRTALTCTGTTAHFFRIFPHTVITLVANEVRAIAASFATFSLIFVAHYGPIPQDQRGLANVCIFLAFLRSCNMHSLAGYSL
jgi:hypothetical protein